MNGSDRRRRVGWLAVGASTLAVGAAAVAVGVARGAHPSTTGGPAAQTASRSVGSPQPASPAELVAHQAIASARSTPGARVTSAAYVVTTVAAYEGAIPVEKGTLTGSGVDGGDPLVVVRLVGVFPEGAHSMPAQTRPRRPRSADTFVQVADLRTGRVVERSWQTQPSDDLRRLGPPIAVPVG